MIELLIVLGAMAVAVIVFLAVAWVVIVMKK